MSTPEFRWQYVRDIALQIVPPEGATGNYRAEYPYQCGVIYIEAFYGATPSRFPNSIQVSIQHIQRGYFPVLKVETRFSDYLVTLFKDGKWVEVLANVAQEQSRLRSKKLITQAIEEDRKTQNSINDHYLFPEYLDNGTFNGAIPPAYRGRWLVTLHTCGYDGN